MYEFQGYKALAINMNLGSAMLTSDLMDVFGNENVMPYGNRAESIANFITYRLCKM